MRRLRIVIADDHQLMRSALMTLLLADGGFEVDGLTVLDEVHKRYPAVRVIMISAVDQDEVVRAALKRGADAFVLKRVDPRDVCAIVRQVVERTVFQSQPPPDAASTVE